jgi:CHAT domain-containing protein
LWWCPTGPFTFLPIHAAGIYSASDSVGIFDYAVSSYIPTVSALLKPPPTVTADPFKLMVVIQPNTPGQGPLPCTVNELRHIRNLVPEEYLLALGETDHPAHVETVSSQLGKASMVHFSCHGQQDPMNPIESSLILNDGRLTVSKMIKESTPHASLAFLSACQTAMGDESLPDEVLHLAAALLFTGFHGAVATMW